ncbi:hypothetical protein KH388_22580, partial [Serratia rubidaea]|nr:hypothetical protein [Serratia rubidaea]
DDLFFQEKKGRKLYFTPVLNKGKRSVRRHRFLMSPSVPQYGSTRKSEEAGDFSASIGYHAALLLMNPRANGTPSQG